MSNYKVITKHLNNTNNNNNYNKMEITEKHQQILDILKQEGELATSKITFLISTNLYKANELLQDLELNDLIFKTQKGKITLWRLK